MIKEDQEFAELNEYRREVSGYLRYMSETHNIPGISVSIISNGYQVSACHGVSSIGGNGITRNHSFQAGRALKFLLALVAIDLRRESVLRIDAKVSEYLSEFEGSRFGESVCISHLMSECSGIITPDFTDQETRARYTWRDLVSDVLRSESLFQPGAVVSTSLANQLLLAEILQRATGKSVSRLIEAMLDGVRSSDLQSTPRSSVDSHENSGPKRQVCRVDPREIGPLLKQCGVAAQISTEELAKLTAGLFGADIEESPGTKISAVCSASTRIPIIPQSPFADDNPNGSALGCLMYSGEWFGVDGPVIGQSLSLRFERSRRFIIGVGMNRSIPIVSRAIREEIVRSIGMQPMAASSRDVSDIGLSAGDIEGTYFGCTGGKIEVARQSESVIVGVLTTKAIRRPVPIKFCRDADDGWKLEDDKSPFSAGFFVEPNSREVCISLGNVVYRMGTVRCGQSVSLESGGIATSSNVEATVVTA